MNKGIFMERIKPLISIFAISFSFSFSANALVDNFAVECDYCITDNQFEFKAREAAITDNTVIVNVVNFDNLTYKRYSITKNSYIECEYDNEPDGRGGKLQICRRRFNYESYQQVVNSTEMADFIKLARAKNELDNYNKQRITQIPDTITQTGLDLVGNSAIQNDVIEFFNNDTASLQQFQDRNAAYLSALTSVIQTSVIKISAPIISFKFDDGSIAYSQFEYIDVDGQLHFKFLKVIFNKNTFNLENIKVPFNSLYIRLSGLNLPQWQKVFDLLYDYGLTVRGTSRDTLPSNLPTGKITSVCQSGDKDCVHPN